MESKYESKNEYIPSESKIVSSSSELADSKAPALSPEELVRKVQEYFYSNEVFGNELESFAERNAHIINVEEAERNEFRLDYTSVYNEYKALLEGKIERYIENELNSDIRQFYRALSDRIDANPTGQDAMFTELFLGIANFDCFMMMMKEKSNKK